LSIYIPALKSQAGTIISGATGISTLVNIGTGLSDLILLPLKARRDDGRVMLGVQKGVGSAMRRIGGEGVRIGSKIAAGGTVFFEEVDERLNGTIHSSQSKFAEQPAGVVEGAGMAVRALRQGVAGGVVGALRGGSEAVTKVVIGVGNWGDRGRKAREEEKYKQG
jgi:hypothetical protein